MDSGQAAVKSLVVVYSYHHHNTEKVARAIAEVWGAEIKAPKHVRPEELAQYDLVGFGSGVYFGKLHQDLVALAAALPATAHARAFVFSTSATPNKGPQQHQSCMAKWHGETRSALEARGWTVVGDWNCAGWLTLGPLKLIGGITRGRPNEEDLASAREFAQEMKGKAAG